ncbi:MAG: cytochrome C [Campylobacterales bacterium]|nr:cytochrome C [Campylobacterales bacterium]
MNKLLKLAFAGAVALTLSTTTASADVAKGQKLYQKKLKEVCGGMTGAKMAVKHTQDEWKALKEGGKLNEEIKKICGQETNEKYLPHLYDFFYEYASDSGNVPSC